MRALVSRVVVACTLPLMAACDVVDAPAPGPDAASGKRLVFDEPFECEQLKPYLPPATSLGNMALGWEARTLDLAVVVDETYAEVVGPDWAVEATALIDEMDGFYRRELNLEINLVQLEVLPGFRAEKLYTDQPRDIMTAMIASYDEHFGETAREAVLALFGTRATSRAMGMANCIGVAGIREMAYAWSEGVARSSTDLVGLNDWQKFPRVTAIHEIGHLLGGHHHYTSCATDPLAVSTDDPLGSCDAIAQYVDLAAPFLSETNALFMRGWIEHIDL